MSGILDKKERIIDFIITENGRSQIQDNDIRIKFASFSDSSINYVKDFEISLENKSEISNSEFYYLPLENSTKNLSNINPEFSLNKLFSFNYGNVLNLNKLSDEEKINLLSFDDYDNQFVKFYKNFSFLANIKNLKLLTTERLLSNSSEFLIEDAGFGQEIHDFKLNSNKYKTVYKYKDSINNLPIIALDNKFSHKTNYKVLIPKDISGKDLYEKKNFKRIEQNTSNYKSSSYMFNSFIVKDNDMNNENIVSREKEISKIIDSLEKDHLIFRKEHNIVNNSERCTLLFEFNEIHCENISSTDPEKKSMTVEKLHFIKVGDFYVENILKKVYLIGKIVNSRESDEDLDKIFSFNDGTVNLKNTSTFAISAYYSFVTMFTLIVE